MEGILDVLDKNNMEYENLDKVIIVKNMNKNKLKPIIEYFGYYTITDLDFVDILDKYNQYYCAHIYGNGNIVITVLINTLEICFFVTTTIRNFEKIYILYKYLAENYIFYNDGDDNIKRSYILQDGKKYYVRFRYGCNLSIESEDGNDDNIIMLHSIEKIVSIMSKNFPDSIKQTDIKIALK
jgi:hypothetical protein